MAENFLLEIGTEELPARFVLPALKSIKEEAEKLLSAYRLTHEGVVTGGTFRRLSLFVKGLAEKQEDLEEELIGPSLKVGLDADGNFTKAAIGFARKHGISPSELQVKQTEKGEYFFVKKFIPGKPALEILPELVKELLKRIYFPKSMRWGAYEFSFGRPIRWIVCLFGKEALPFEIAGVKSGRSLFAHRFLSPEPLELEEADWEEYKSLLKKHFVILLPEERVKETKRTVEEVASKVGKVEIDEELLLENANLVEYPFPVLGSFPEEFLELPAPLIITALKEHQRYFCVRDESGRLLNYFVAVNNNLARDPEVVRKGHERVTKARLEDAKFYYERDLKVPLEQMVERLEGVVYHIKCGSLKDKTERLINLGLFLDECLELAPDRELLKVAAKFSKADLASEVVKEFPSLQGVMGSIYLEKAGYEEVARAIYEQYLPMSSDESLPQTPEGIILSLADRIDHLSALFAAGERATGVKDPYALRRAAYGIVKVLTGKKLFLDLEEAFKKALSLLKKQGFWSGNDSTLVSELLSFVKGRLRGELLSQGFSKEIVNCVLNSSPDVYDIFLKASALRKFQQETDFEEFFIGFKRVVQILKKVELNSLPGVNPELFQKEAEKAFYEKITELKPRLKELFGNKNYLEYLRSLGELKPVIDRFFDEVFVMAEDKILRENRLGLLKEAFSLFRNFGDLEVLI